MSSRQDRANTNKTCPDQLEDSYVEAKPTRNWCCAHRAREYAKLIFNEPMKQAHGVRFFIKHEQLYQIAKHSPKYIIETILLHLWSNMWSEKSRNTILEASGGNKNKGALGMAILECSVISNGGKSYAEGSYIFRWRFMYYPLYQISTSKD